MLASTPKVDFYAMVGGVAEKCIAGAPDNGFGAEPVQLSVAAGVGVRYKMTTVLPVCRAVCIPSFRYGLADKNLAYGTAHQSESVVRRAHDLLILNTIQI